MCRVMSHANLRVSTLSANPHLIDTINFQLVSRTDLRPLPRNYHDLHNSGRHLDTRHEQYWLELITNGRIDTRLRSTSEVESDVISRLDNNNNLTATCDETKYLDIELLSMSYKWLENQGILLFISRAVKHLKFHMLILVNGINRSPSTQSESNFRRRNSLDLDATHRMAGLEELNNNQEDNFVHQVQPEEPEASSERGERVKTRLLKSLQSSRLVDLLLLTCHITLLSTSADLVGHLLRDTLQYLRLPTYPFSGLSPLESTSHASRLNTLTQYLLTITLLDLAGRVQWYYYRECFEVKTSGPQRSFRFIEKRGSILRCAALTISSPRHTCQIVYALVLVIFGPFQGSTGLLVGLFNSLSQTLCHIYNIYRIGRYSKLIKEGWNFTSESVDKNSNLLFGGRILRDRRTGEICDIHSGKRRGGWSGWPVELSVCDCEFAESMRFRFEHTLMLIQIAGIKLIVFALLFYIDGLSSINKFEGFLSFCCMVEVFLAVHFYYDKYLARYIEGKIELATC